MKTENFVLESPTLFSESLLWQLNRDFYCEKGISAWSDDLVPHHMTSNSKCAKTYANIIFALLQDLAVKKKIKETVYIVELGAGHARLAFQILKHLEKLVKAETESLPKYCYVLSDIAEDNLSFFKSHPQLQSYFEQGKMDIAFFDAVQSTALHLRNSNQTIFSRQLNQPIVAIANYFFDSIPNDLLYIKDQEVSNCSIAINSEFNPNEMNTENKIEHMTFDYSKKLSHKPIYEDVLLNEILEDYKTTLDDTYLFFPKKGMACIKNIEALSASGLMLLTMDKGFHELHNLKNKKEPEIITHGSLSIWVNYHALSAYCTKQGGKVLFPSYSNFHLEIGCLLFLKDATKYTHVDMAYHQSVNEFGPDDFNSIKQLAYQNISKLRLKELIALCRLGIYDATFFIKLLPRLKQVSKQISSNERTRLAETMDFTWNMYFHINESFDLAYEIGGLLYDLGYYNKALTYFQRSVDIFGMKEDIYYNQALSYYQLREDDQFYKTLNKAKAVYPDSKLFEKLDTLQMD